MCLTLFCDARAKRLLLFIALSHNIAFRLIPILFFWSLFYWLWKVPQSKKLLWNPFFVAWSFLLFTSRFLFPAILDLTLATPFCQLKPHWLHDKVRIGSPDLEVLWLSPYPVLSRCLWSAREHGYLRESSLPREIVRWTLSEWIEYRPLCVLSISPRLSSALTGKRQGIQERQIASL